MPMKKAKAHEDERMIDIPAEGDMEPDARVQPEEDTAMEEDAARDGAMSLGQVIWKISESDPVLNRWAEKINDSSRRKDRRVWPAPGDGNRAALSSSAATPLAQVDITEVYSPPRVTVVAKKTGLNPGSAMDLRTGYDFSTKEDRERARQQIRKEKPKLLVGSPECKMFSTLQHLSPWTVDKAKKLVEAKAHMRFVCDLYEEQINEGRWFSMSIQWEQRPGKWT